MANIRYKLNDKQLDMLEINPYTASKDELRVYTNNLIEKREYLLEKIENIYREDHLCLKYDAECFIHRLKEYSENSTPFDEKILNDDNVISVDGLARDAFQYEENFRKCLAVYYELLKSDEALRICLKILLRNKN